MTTIRYIFLFFYLLLAGLEVVYGQSSQTIPPPDTIIENVATGTYINHLGAETSVASNAVKFAVLPFPSIILEIETSVRVFRGTEISFDHFVQNTGNTTVTIDIDIINLDGDDFDLTEVSVVQSSRSGLQPVKGSSVEASVDVVLQPGERYDFAYTGTVEKSNQPEMIAEMLVEARIRETGFITQRIDRAIILNGAEMELIKTQSSTADLKTGDIFTYTLEGLNIGDTTAVGREILVDGISRRAVILRDSIPANVSFNDFVSLSKGEFLYHTLGAGEFVFSSIPPAQLDRVDVVGLAMDSLITGETFEMAFSVRINDNATGNIQNKADVTFVNPDGEVTTISASNTVVAALPDKDAVLDYYTDGTFNQKTRTSTIGKNLYLEANASACNELATVAERAEITIVSNLTGDTEIYTGEETGVNTGIFRIVDDVRTRNALQFQPQSGNTILETLEKDVLTATLKCAALVNQTTAIRAAVVVDPFGVVFDAETNRPVAGAQVRLFDLTNGTLAEVFDVDGTTPVSANQTTGDDGSFRFPFLNPGRYRVEVIPPDRFNFPSDIAVTFLDPGRKLDEDASYGREIEISGTPAPFEFDIPLDSFSANALLIEKRADKRTVDLGGYINYSIKVTSRAVNTVNNLRVEDKLPFGFEYQPGSARIDDGNSVAGIPDPAGANGPNLTFPIGSLASGASFTLRYRVYVGPGAMKGDGINVAFAESQDLIVRSSSQSRVKVEVNGGVFSEDAFIIGKVFVDANQNQMQDAGEPGIPGVRLFLENGSYIVTDIEGRYTFYAVKPNKHVLKLDNTSLPEGARLEVLDSRHALDPSSRFADVKKGELHRADFAICDCADGIYDEIERRKKLLSGFDEITAGIGQEFNMEDQRINSSARTASQSSGVIGGGNVERVDASDVNGGFDTTATEPISFGKSVLSLEEEIQLFGPETGFMNFYDGDTLFTSTSDVRVKARTGAVLKLFLNGEEISEERIGKRAMSQSGVMALEFISIHFVPGWNELALIESDPFGNPRGKKEIKVLAPGKLESISVTPVRNDVPADGQSSALVKIQLLDKNGIPTGTKTPITLDVSLGKWLIEDLNTEEPGTQVVIEYGVLEVALQSTIEPQTVDVRAYAGTLQGSTKINFLPDLRPMIAAGIIEGTLRLNDPFNISSSTDADGFERELVELSTQFNDFTADARVAFFLKGKISGDMLLTASYDSEQEDKTRLFRDIRPDEFYPVYGESSIKGFEAQSTSRLFIRVDKNKTYALYGDFITQERDQARQLADYSRAQTGFRGHLEEGKLQVNAFSSSAFTARKFEEFNARGISRYTLPDNDIIENSEIVELVTFDREQPDVILEVKRLTRFRDYTLEAFTGTLIFTQSVPSVDQNFNTIKIRVQYEVETADERYFVGGVDGKLQVNDNLSVGAVAVKDNDPENEFRLFGLNTEIQLSHQTKLIAEVAQTDTDLNGTGNAGRVEVQHRGKSLDVNAQVGKSGDDFSNQAGTLGQGNTEARSRVRIGVDSKTNLNGEFLYSENDSTGRYTVGALVNIQRNFANAIRGEFGFRYSRQDQGNTQPNADAVENKNVLMKATTSVPGMKKATVFGEYEQDLDDADRRLVATGGEYQLKRGGKVYLRHEFISSVGGRFTMRSNAQRNNTVFGVQTGYMKNGEVYSEYRVNDAFDGRSAQAAIGLRNRFQVKEGFGVSAGFERVFTVDGPSQGDATAISVSADYTANPDWKGSARAEARFAGQSNQYFYSVGYGRKITNNWTLLAKNLLALYTQNGFSGFSRVQQRFRIGAAFRDFYTNRFDALFRYEWKLEEDDPLSLHRTSHIFSAHANYHPNSNWTLSGRFAGRAAIENDDFFRSSNYLHLISGRAIYDINDTWDVGVNASIMGNGTFGTRDYGLGGEVGFIVARNLRLATGFNIFGFHDADLSANNYTNKGVYTGFSYKFDEQLFAGLIPDRNKRKNFINPELYLTCTGSCEEGAERLKILTMAIPRLQSELHPAKLKAPDFDFTFFDLMLLLPRQIHFDNNKEYITPASAKMLDKIANLLTNRDEYSINISGHTDTKASYEYNLALSNRRARAVRAYLIASGVELDKLSYKGFSYEAEKYAGVDEIDMALNRRVEIELTVNHMEVRQTDQIEDIQVQKGRPLVDNWNYVFTFLHNAVPGNMNLKAGEKLNAVHAYLLARISLAMQEYSDVKAVFHVATEELASQIAEELYSLAISSERFSTVLSPGAESVEIQYINGEVLDVYEQRDDLHFAGKPRSLALMNKVLELLKNRQDFNLIRSKVIPFTVPSEVRFSKRELELGYETQAVLSRIGSYLRDFENVQIELYHNGEPININRSGKIKEYLTEWGIAEDRIELLQRVDIRENQIRVEYRKADLIHLLKETIDSGTEEK